MSRKMDKTEARLSFRFFLLTLVASIAVMVLYSIFYNYIKTVIYTTRGIIGYLKIQVMKEGHYKGSKEF